MPQRFYLDTSVFGGYFDEEFSEHTIPLFESLNLDQFILLFSSVTQEELEDAPERVRELVKTIRLESTEFLTPSTEEIGLANEYIVEGVVGETSFADCLHIAMATVTKADFLISWNFKHIVNVQRIRGYNSINIKRGYQQLEIRSPREFRKYEDN